MKMYRNIFISYLCVCMVPLLLSLFTCLKLEQSVRETMLRDQERMVDAVWTDLNETLESSYNASRILTEDALLRELANSYTLTSRQRMEQSDLSDQLNAASAHGGCVGVFAYFYRSGHMVTNVRSYEKGNMAAFFQPFGFSTAEFDDMLASDQFIRTPAVLGEGENAYLLVLSYYFSTDYSERIACVGMLYPLRSFSMAGGPGEYYLRDRSGNFLFGSALCQAAMEADSAGSGQVSLPEGEYIHFVVSSDCSGLDYGFLIEREAYLAPVRWSRLQLALEFFLFASVGIILSVFLSRQTYSPYRRMLALLRQSQQDSGDGSSRELERSLRELIAERQMVENQLTSHRQQMHNGMLSGLLTGHSRDLSILSEYIEDGEPYRVLVLFFHNLEESSFFENVPQKQFASAADMLFYAVRNLLEEMVLQTRGGVSLTMDGFVAMVFQSSEEDRQLRRDLEQAVAFMERHLYLSVTCSVSGPWSSLEDAPLAYNEALAAEQISGGGHLQIANEEGFSASRVWDALNLPLRKKIMGAFRAGRLNEAREGLDEFFSGEAPAENTAFFHLRKGQCIDLIYFLHRYAGLPQADADDGLRRIMAASNGLHIRNEVVRLFDEVYKGQTQAAADNPGGGGDWVKEIQSYIEENHADGRLNVSAIAARWNMSLNAVSRKFRAAAGHSILDEIHLTRLSHAKALLQEGRTVKETAELTGYLDSRAMIQSFKRYEGITPGQIKKQ